MQAMCQLHGRDDAREPSAAQGEEALSDATAGEQFLERCHKLPTRTNGRN